MNHPSESLLVNELAQIIEQGKNKVSAQVNSIITMVYWQVGFKINTYILEGDRAKYGKNVVADISDQLTSKYGKSFELRNLRRMMQFAEVFSEFEIVSPLAT